MRVLMLKEHTEPHTEGAQSFTLRFPAGTVQDLDPATASRLLADGSAELQPINDARVKFIANVEDIRGRFQKGTIWHVDLDFANELVHSERAELVDDDPEFNPVRDCRAAAIAVAKAIAPAPITASADVVAVGAEHEEG